MSYPGSPPPPPWANITGITRTVMKDNAQETVANYNGNARAGEMTVNPNTGQIYIGNTDGNLNLVISSNGSNLFLAMPESATLCLLDFIRCIIILPLAKLYITNLKL